MAPRPDVYGPQMAAMERWRRNERIYCLMRRTLDKWYEQCEAARAEYYAARDAAQARARMGRGRTCPPMRRPRRRMRGQACVSGPAPKARLAAEAAARAAASSGRQQAAAISGSQQAASARKRADDDDEK